MSDKLIPPFRPRAHIESEFLPLRNIEWSHKSPRTRDYQCIAWAACYTNRRFWPLPSEEGYFWPNGRPLFDDSLENFVDTFAMYGYKPCDNPEFEFGFQKVAIYAGREGVRHMARQHFFGRGWLSKLGDEEDILHANLESIEGTLDFGYGRVERILKRSWWQAVIHLSIFRIAWAALKFWCYRLIYNPNRKVTS